MFHRAGPNRPHAPSSRWHEGVLPRDAFFAPKEAISADDAIGRIAAEQITPYPPGIR